MKLVGFQCIRYNVHNKAFKRDSQRVALSLYIDFISF